jgi:hypothetical protein
VSIIGSVVGSAIVTYSASNKTIRHVSDTSDMTIKSISNDNAHKFIAMGYAMSKASKENKTVDLEDMKDGFDFANKVITPEK